MPDYRRIKRVDSPVGGSKRDGVDAGPFLSWLDQWRAVQDEMRRCQSAEGRPRPVAGLQDLAALADVSVRAFGRARETGRVSYVLVDRVLVAAGGDTPLSALYPELYD